MTINSINGVNTQMGQTGMNQAADSYSRNIQNQIANAQKQLQELSSNEGMSLEEKMKKRQEIQQQISELNVQLRQHQIEQRRAAQGNPEKQQAKGSTINDMLGGKRNAGSTKTGSKNTGLSQASMTAMISADSSLKQAKVQGSVAVKMEGRAGILESEIKLDQARGNGTLRKEEELAEAEQRAQAATSSQLSTLADAGKTMEEAAKADSKAERTDNKDEKATEANGKKPVHGKGALHEKSSAHGKDPLHEKDSEENVSGEKTMEKMHSKGEIVSGSESVNTKSDMSSSGSTAAETTPQQPAAYVSVDIRL